MSETLKACPFCGARSELTDNGSVFWVECVGCGIETHSEHNEAAAIAAWNTRALASTPAPSDARAEAQRWEPTRWWRVVDPETGRMWMETSDEEEARAEAEEKGWPLERNWQTVRQFEWRIAAAANTEEE